MFLFFRSTPYSVWSRAVLSVNLWRTISNHRSQTVPIPPGRMRVIRLFEFCRNGEVKTISDRMDSSITGSFFFLFHFQFVVHSLSELPSGYLCPPFFMICFGLFTAWIAHYLVSAATAFS